MRRAIVAGTATVSGVILLLGLKSHGDGVQGTAQNFSIGSTTGSPSSAASPSAPATGTPSPGTSATPGASSNSGSSNGSSGSSNSSSPNGSNTGNSGSKVVTGDAAETQFGPVQLQVTFSGKKITGINVLEYPTDTMRDQEINSYALPQLNQEAMAAQSAHIDVISGATYTSEGYQQSLQSALDKAGI